jgi:PAS domain S-box-containing protein
MQLRVRCLNKQARLLTGLSTKDALGAPLEEVFPPDGGELRSLITSVMESGKPIRGARTYIVNTHGERIPVIANTAPVLDETGTISGTVVSLEDNRAIEALRLELRHKYTFGDIVTRDHRMLRLLQILPTVAESESTVLIVGPTGTGKELFAHALHSASPRSKGPFVAVNCAALPDTLLESELFGYKKGAFTDAKRDKPGRLALATGGTLFLDEVGDLSLTTQAKLLRVLEGKQYQPLGATQSVEADVRIIAATNQDLSSMVESGQFRSDLYYRLNVIGFRLPALSERPGDIPLLVEHFIEVLNAEKGRHIKQVSPAAMSWLMRCDYPGNVRELRSIIERAYVLCPHDQIEEDCLSMHLLGAPPSELPQQRRAPLPLRRLPSEEQRRVIYKTLREHNGHRGKTAEALGIDKSTLWRKMKKHGIEFATPSD